jgi:dGTPase
VLLKRIDLEKRERGMLASYASFSDTARREFKDSNDEFRTQFQRDHARVVHSKAFRRLRGKTQVFIAHHGDHYRNRLSHTLEVSQISRSLARNLAVNEDLAGAIALAHDLGHTPFGHTGEERLNKLMQGFDKSFEHNIQSRRILTTLEKKYVGSEGLNVTLDLLDGLAKHATPYDRSEVSEQQPSLEAQIVNLADEIAYTNHDIDDGLRAGIFKKADLTNLTLWQQAIGKVDSKLPNDAFNHRAVSALIELLTTDLLQETSQKLETNKIKSLDEVKNFHEALVSFSTEVQNGLEELRKFLREDFYFAPKVKKLSDQGADILEQIFQSIYEKPELLPQEFVLRLEKDTKENVVADFVAGMTDDFAIEFAKKLKT